jgi:hypothetical protein
MPYAAPLEEMRFVLDTLAPPDGAVERDVADAILAEAARFAAAELDPLNQPADRVGPRLDSATRTGAMSRPDGWGCNAILIMAVRGCRCRSPPLLSRCGTRPA